MMGNFRFTETEIKGVYIIETKVFGDDRGYFTETYKKTDFDEAGLRYDFVQDNQSFSRGGVLRGLHFQINHPQTKLVRVVRGEVFDVAVDLRQGSETYGRWHGEIISAENRNQFLIPGGFAHGFLVLSDEAEFCYKCDDFYHPGDEGGIAWNDPGIGIIWPGVSGNYPGSASPDGYRFRGEKLSLSERDRRWGVLSEKDVNRNA